MSSERPQNSFDAIVIGAGIGGLTAAAYLARARLRVALVEARDRLGGRADRAPMRDGIQAPVMAHLVYALDPRIIRQLALERHGLRYAKADRPLVALRRSGRHLVLPPGVIAATRAIHAEAAADARSYWRYRREVTSLARHLEPLWSPKRASVTEQVRKLPPRIAERLELYTRSSASALLDRWFESDTLKALLAAEACIDGLSPQEPGSALALLWRAMQMTAAHREAHRPILGGPASLAHALGAAAARRGAVIRTNARATGILTDGARSIGVRLQGGESLHAPLVLSGVSARQTFLDLLAAHALPLALAARLRDAPRIGSAKLDIALKGPPPFAGLAEPAFAGRLLVVERPEAAAEAKAAALLGALPRELVLEISVPTVADPALAPAGRHMLSVRIPYMPLQPEGGWAKHRETLRKKSLATLETYAPGLADRVTSTVLITPDESAALYGTAADGTASLTRLLSSFESRIRTPIAGLYLCGADAEPFDVISGRAGRVAASIAVEDRRRARA